VQKPALVPLEPMGPNRAVEHHDSTLDRSRTRSIFPRMKSLVPLLAASLLLAAAPFAAADPVPPGPGEYVIVTGGVSLHVWEKWKAAPHDGWWMNFVRAARLRINEIQTANPEADITWLVYRPAYQTRGAQDGREYLADIRSVQETYHVRLIFFDRTSEFIEYLNNGQNRRGKPICDLEYFGHSNKACWMFDYSNNIDSASKVWLHENDLPKIHRGIFAKNAYVKSWGCYSGESFTKRFASLTGSKMIGAKGKTQYRDEELPFLSTPGGYWVH